MALGIFARFRAVKFEVPRECQSSSYVSKMQGKGVKGDRSKVANVDEESRMMSSPPCSPSHKDDAKWMMKM